MDADVARGPVFSSTLHVQAIGAVVAIDVANADDALAAAVYESWRDARARGTTAPDAVVPVSTPGDARMALATLSQEVTRAAIDARRGAVWMLHAAGVADDDGRVVVLVGPSGRGKTTASRVLSRGFGYVSDETVAIDSGGRVHPYRKPFSVIDGGSGVKAQLAPSDVGALPLPDRPLRVVAIALLDRRDESVAPRVESIDPFDNLPELVEQTSYLTDLPSPLRTIMAHLDAVGGLRRVVYHSAEDLHETIGALATRAPAPVTVASPIDLTSAPSSPRAPREPSYARAPYIDAVPAADSDRIAVLTRDEHGQGRVQVLSGIAPTLWRAATSASEAVLTAAAVEAHGAPAHADPGHLVADAVAEMVRAGLLLKEPAG